ncbi:hypothetical protein CLOP_g20858 [Closterium sp. NIES-67]|nr:hypothetical protein CLOP_g20858 [Closterium sp. NIES-67]
MNYSTWRLKFIRRAKEVGLWKYYDQHAVVPDETASDKEKAAYKEKSKHALFQLCNSVADGIAIGMDDFVDEVNAAQLGWDHMDSLYMGKTEANMANVRQKLILLHLKPNETIAEYVNRAKSYGDELKAMGVPETEKQMISYVIGGLPDEWEAHKGNVSCSRPKTLTELAETLQSLELIRTNTKNRKKLLEELLDENPALVNVVGAGKPMGACFHCGKKGHKAVECFSNPKSPNFKGRRVQHGGGTSGEGQRGRGTFPGTCNHCNKYGHKAMDCYSNPNSKNFRGAWPQEKMSTPAKANAMEAEKAKENDAIMGGAHKANVARASSACLLAKGLQSKAWFMDSGCTQHMTNRAAWLQNFRMSTVPHVLLGDDGQLEVKGEGDMVLQSPFGELKLDSVLFVDKLSLNLISQTQLDGSGCKTFSDNGKLWVFGSNWKMLAEGERKQGLYEMRVMEKPMPDAKVTYLDEPEEGKKAREELLSKMEEAYGHEWQQQALMVAAKPKSVDLNIMHRRMAHASSSRIKELFKKEMVTGVELKEDNGVDVSTCTSCVEGKNKKAPHPKHGTKEEPYEAMEIVAADVCGPMRVASRHGSKYFVTFTDIGTRNTWVSEIKDKTQVLECFKEWLAEAERQSGKLLKVLRSDNGGEFVNKAFDAFLREKGIRRQLTIPYTPQHNSIAERVNRTLLEGMRSMLSESGLTLDYWGDAVAMACWLKNRMPTKGLAADITPYEAFYKRKPNLGFLRVWGCMVQYREPTGPDHKLLSRTKWGVHLGPSTVSKGWIVRDVETGKLVATRDGVFYEEVNYMTWKKGRKDDTVNRMHTTSPINETSLFEAEMEGLGAESDLEEVVFHGAWEHNASPPNPKESVETSEAPNDKDNGVGAESNEVEVLEAEEEHEPMEGAKSTTESSGPWRHMGSKENEKEVEEIEGFLKEGAILIGQEEEEEMDNEATSTSKDAEPDSEEERMGRGRRIKKPNPNVVGSQYANAIMTCFKDIHTHLLLTISATALVSKATRAKYNLPDEPVTIEEALSGPYHKEWRKAIQEELDTLAERGTWVLVELPEGRRPVGVRWIFKIKTGDLGQLQRFKARLVAKGYTQVEGVDYVETYAPVSKLTTARTLLKVVAARDYHLVQLDIKNAFLYGELQEEIYMEQPPGCEDGTNRKCKLIKALYGLKQSPREWYKAMDEHLIKGGFEKSQSDRAFYWRGEGKEKVFLLLYVDDILVAGALEEEVEGVCKHLASVFQVKRIPRASLFLGMNLERSREERKLFLYQKKYSHRLKERFGDHLGAKLMVTPLSSLAGKEVDVEEEMDAWGSQEKALKAYQCMVGSVMYPVSCTRVDISYAASFLGQNVLKPEGRKWKEMERTLTYLVEREDEGLLFEGGEESLELVGYADASHASDKETRRGAYGYVYLLGGTAIMWQAKKLDDIALSSAEAEYMALFYACQEGVWLRRLLNEMDINMEGPITIKSDSQSAIALAQNDNWHGRTKHMDVKYHWVREQLQKKAFVFEHVGTKEQPADFLTKVLPKENFEHCKELVGMRNITALHESGKGSI